MAAPHVSLPLLAGSRAASETGELAADHDGVVIPNCWYALCDASKVGAKAPLSIQRLGRRWVLWRDSSDAVVGLPAACPHRGADLGLGRVREGQIECPYHGFRFDGAGRCTLTPCEGKDARIPAGLHTRGPDLREAHGLVWMWVGPEQPGELGWIEAAPIPSRASSTWEEVWDIPFTRVMEGMQDLHHFPFAHRKIDPWRGRAARADPFEFEAEGDHLRQRMGLCRDEPGAKPVAEFGLEVMFPGLVYLEFGAGVVGTVAVAPIDEDRTWIWVCYHVQTGLGALVDRLASWLGLLAEFGLVQPDDKRMLASSWPRHPRVSDHNLVRSDASIAAWHKRRRRRLSELSAPNTEASCYSASADHARAEP